MTKAGGRPARCSRATRTRRCRRSPGCAASSTPWSTTGPCAATCSRATATPPTSSSRPRTTAAPLLRFGDDVHGRRPEPTAPQFTATYRVGNGSAGNVGRGRDRAHRHATWRACSPTVTNPMPAAGGIDPEDIEAARRDAPEAFRTQERAVTAADYAAAARTPRRRAARRGDVPLDRQLAHGVRHRRPLRRRRGRCALRGAAAPPPRTLPHGRLRPRSRCAALCGARHHAAHLRAARLLPQRSAARGARRARQRRAARRPPRRCSIPTTSRSASRCT